MSTTILDSVVYGSLWTSSTLTPLFEEAERTRALLEILAVLAEVEGEHGVVPIDAARGIAETCRSIVVEAAFLEELRRGREASGHSTAGLLRAVAGRCPAASGEWVHFGATVQDVTDTWLMSTLAAARRFFERQLSEIERSLSQMAAEHRDTVMLGRTHGQQGLPITFGFKVAGWAAEIRRHRTRLAELRPRLEVGQLAGGVGSLSALGPDGLAVQAAFCARLGLAAPDFTWTASRDVIAEWAFVLTLVCGTADRIGHEVYNLQRAEIGELSEASPAGAIGSLTMPQKRNPELSEHLGTLARIVRHQAACLAEGLVHDHERDGRSWKVEWHVVPELTLLAGRAVELLAALSNGLVVHADRMRRNVEATRGLVLSEALMLAVAARCGRETAHRLVHEATQRAHESGWSLEEVVRATPDLRERIGNDELRGLLDYEKHTGLCGELVDRFLAAREEP